jgi:lipopolysaccharide/colanic/teichoic acid biosynthesis glycosyltransferase
VSAARSRRLRFKRGIDVAVAGIGLVAGSPLLGAIALAVLVSMGRPVFFRQQRPGLDGRPFTLIKFRTMRAATHADGTPLPDHERITRLGRLLRATSLDELPELWNVLRGDMSLVGPRPLLMAYLDRYTPEQARRHAMRPGITGLAQVRGRNALTWESKFALDREYIDRWSLWLDLRILVRTVWQVVRREGINATQQSTMPEFVGTARTMDTPLAQDSTEN